MNNQKRVEPKVGGTTERLGSKTTTARSLFKSEYSDQVLARRDEVLKHNPDIERLAAYNQALALEWADFQKNNAEDLERLEAAARGLRSEAQGGIDQQTPEMQQRCAPTYSNFTLPANITKDAGRSAK